MSSPRQQSYGQRALKKNNPTAKLLLETMERKKSNLAVSVDVTKTKDFLAIIDVVGPYVCLIKAIFIPSKSFPTHSHGFSNQDTHWYHWRLWIRPDRTSPGPQYQARFSHFWRQKIRRYRSVRLLIYMWYTIEYKIPFFRQYSCTPVLKRRAQDCKLVAHNQRAPGPWTVYCYRPFIRWFAPGAGAIIARRDEHERVTCDWFIHRRCRSHGTCSPRFCYWFHRPTSDGWCRSHHSWWWWWFLDSDAGCWTRYQGRCDGPAVPNTKGSGIGIWLWRYHCWTGNLWEWS